MATSGSVDHSISRDNIITEALQQCGRLGEGQTPNANQLTDCGRTLNNMAKAFIPHGLHLWKITRATLFLEKSKNEYSLGPSGDHATASYTETTLSSAASSGATSISVTSITGISNGDNIGVIVDDGTTHWTTVNGAPSGSTVVLTTALDDAAASGKAVYAYTTKINRPLKIVDTYTQDSSGNDTDVDLFSREEYYRLGNKSSSGPPTEAYYDPQLTNGTLRVFPTPSIGTTSFEFTFESPIEDFDAASDTPDFPQEWYEALCFNLALRLCPKYGVPKEKREEIKEMAMDSLDLVLGFDKEGASMYITPEMR